MKRALALLFCLFLCGCAGQEMRKDTQLLMGTSVEVISPDCQAAGIVFAEMRRIEGLLSKYEPGSEISRLNKYGEIKAGAETFYILSRARDFYYLSGGAFDPTIGPLADLWGFSDKQFRVPADKEIKEKLKKTGFDKIIFNNRNNVVKFKLSGMKVDLGAIAKGYAVDCAAKKLKENNIHSCLINAGGQVYCLGDKAGRAWKVAVRDPRKKGFIRRLDLRDKSVATSGDYEQFFVSGGKRYSHIINPKSGYPAASGIISATIVANDGLTADALSTAVFVLGKDKGLELVRRFGNVAAEIVEEKSVQNN